MIKIRRDDIKMRILERNETCANIDHEKHFFIMMRRKKYFLNTSHSDNFNKEPKTLLRSGARVHKHIHTCIHILATE